MGEPFSLRRATWWCQRPARSMHADAPADGELNGSRAAELEAMARGSGRFLPQGAREGATTAERSVERAEIGGGMAERSVERAEIGGGMAERSVERAEIGGGMALRSGERRAMGGGEVCESCAAGVDGGGGT